MRNSFSLSELFDSGPFSRSFDCLVYNEFRAAVNSHSVYLLIHSSAKCIAVCIVLERLTT